MLRSLGLSRSVLLYQRIIGRPYVTNDVNKRVIDVIRTFNKSKGSKRIETSYSLSKDLGLDSLDTVELIVALEEEFSMEFPDKEAERMKTVAQLVDYVAANSTDIPEALPTVESPETEIT